MMNNKKEVRIKLEELAKEIEDAKELGDFYEKRESNKENKLRCYFSRINQFKLLVEKTQMELDSLFSRFDFQSGSTLDFILARWGYYKKSIANLKKEIRNYSTQLTDYQNKYEDMFCDVLDGRLG